MRPGGPGLRTPLNRPRETLMEATKTKLVNYSVKNGVAWLELADRRRTPTRTR